jgi:hypothetical protein
MNLRKQWELDRLLRVELSRRFIEAGWIAAVGEGVDDVVLCAFRKNVSEDFWATASFWYENGSAVLGDYPEFSGTVGVSYFPAYCLWPVLGDFTRSEKTIELGELLAPTDETTMIEPMIVTLATVEDVERVADELISPVLEYGLTWVRQYSSVDSLLADHGAGSLRFDGEIEMVPALLAAAGRHEEARRALAGYLALDRDEIRTVDYQHFARRLTGWLDDGAILPDRPTAPGEVDQSGSLAGAVQEPGGEGSGRLCQMGLHSTCPHKIVEGVRLLRRRKGAFALLCNCACHRSCPIGDQNEVAEEEWRLGCTCPGGNSSREIARRVQNELDLRKSQQAEVFRDIDIGHGKPAEQIQREILAAYHNKGYEAPTDFSRISRFIAAGTARRGTKTARSLIEIVGSIRAARRWAEDSAIPGDSRLQNQKDLRRMRRGAGAFTTLATATAVGVYFTRGFIRLGLIVLTILLSIAAAWVGLWASAIGLITPPRRSSRDSE